MSLDCKKNKTMSKIGKILLPVLTVCWMMVIFWFSAAPAPESSEMSYTVGIQIGKIAVADFDAWTTEKQNAFAEKIEYPIRKMAHATEYAILGMLVSGMHMVSVGRRLYDMPGFGLQSMPRPMSFISSLYLEEADNFGMCYWTAQGLQLEF